MDNEYICPCCSRVWPVGCEQGISIEYYAECIVCKFTPVGPGSGDGEKWQLNSIAEEAVRREGVLVVRSNMEPDNHI